MGTQLLYGTLLLGNLFAYSLHYVDSGKFPRPSGVAGVKASQDAYANAWATLFDTIEKVSYVWFSEEEKTRYRVVLYSGVETPDVEMASGAILALASDLPDTAPKLLRWIRQDVVLRQIFGRKDIVIDLDPTELDALAQDREFVKNGLVNIYAGYSVSELNATLVYLIDEKLFQVGNDKDGQDLINKMLQDLRPGSGVPRERLPSGYNYILQNLLVKYGLTGGIPGSGGTPGNPQGGGGGGTGSVVPWKEIVPVVEGVVPWKEIVPVVEGDGVVFTRKTLEQALAAITAGVEADINDRLTIYFIEGVTADAKRKTLTTISGIAIPTSQEIVSVLNKGDIALVSTYGYNLAYIPALYNPEQVVALIGSYYELVEQAVTEYYYSEKRQLGVFVTAAGLLRSLITVAVRAGQGIYYYTSPTGWYFYIMSRKYNPASIALNKQITASAWKASFADAIRAGKLKEFGHVPVPALPPLNARAAWENYVHRAQVYGELKNSLIARVQGDLTLLFLLLGVPLATSWVAYLIIKGQALRAEHTKRTYIISSGRPDYSNNTYMNLSTATESDAVEVAVGLATGPGAKIEEVRGDIETGLIDVRGSLYDTGVMVYEASVGAAGKVAEAAQWAWGTGERAAGRVVDTIQLLAILGFAGILVGAIGRWGSGKK